MGEAVRGHIAAGLALQPVVADGGGRVQPLLDIALLQDLAGLVGAVGPDAGEAVRLELQPDGELVRLAFRPGGARASTLSEMPSRFWTWWPTSWAMT